MNKYIVLQDCELNINGHIKKFKQGQEVEETLYTERFPKKFKKIGTLSGLSHLAKIIFTKVREPKVEKPIKKRKPKKNTKKVEKIFKEITSEDE